MLSALYLTNPVNCMNLYWDSSLKSTTPRVDMWLHPDILIQTSRFGSYCMNDREVANSNFIALDVTPPGDGTQYVPQSRCAS
jgi:hypothetical protein